LRLQKTKEDPKVNGTQLSRAIPRLKKVLQDKRTPVVTEISKRQDPFRVLVSCLLSLRTRDEVTVEASHRLFQLADTAEKLVQIPIETLEQIIYPVAFFRNKAKSLQAICRTLIDHHQGQVPRKLDELLELKGVGRKTANLTVVLGYDDYGICVDIHVHRITNRWGYVKTKTPDETEMALRDKLPKKYWKGINDLLVTFGQNICKPVSPICSQCPITKFCDQTGVTKTR
jgi:endonuclease-3